MTARLRRALNRLRAFFRKAPLDADYDAEVAAHLDLAIEDNLKLGMTAAEARRHALVQFGGVEQAKENHREIRGLPALDVLLQDLRYTARTLRRDRAFTAIAVLILALGIGVNTAVFSVVNTLWLRPLPFQHPQQLAWIASGLGTGGLSDTTFTVDGYELLQRHTRSFQNVTNYDPFFGDSDYTLTGSGEPQPVPGVMVAGDFFQTLGVQPTLGRLFTPEETQKGARHTALLSQGFWQRQFAANPGIVGKTITINRQAVTVIGVLPASFDFGSVFSPGLTMDIFFPAIMDNMRNQGHTLALIGRLKPGVTVAQAQAEINILMPQLRAVHPSGLNSQAAITGLKDYVSGKLRRSLMVLWIAAGLILLIVCVNLANLLLARAAGRGKEFAMRLALGAGRVRLARQLLTESLALASAGAALGTGLAWAIVTNLAHQGSLALPLLSQARVDRGALAWTVLITAMTASIIGFVPSLRLSGGGNLQEALQASGPGMSESRKHRRLRAALVISEIALACVLLASAGLLLRSFLHVLDVDVGFQPSRAAAIKVTYDDGGNRVRRGAILQEILRRVQAIPGVEADGISDMLPLDRNRSWDFWPKDKIYPNGTNLDAFVYVVTPGYLHAMGIRLLEGRDFNWQDTTSSQTAVIINQAAARRYWPGEDAVGRLGAGISDNVRVIGVVDDVSETSLEHTSGPEIYVTATQYNPEGAELVVRSQLPPDALGPEVMKTLRAINPGQPDESLQPLQTLVDHVTSPRRFLVLLVSSFAGLGLILAALGIYGVISYGVTQRTQEVGIRMALGASPGQVRILVLRSTLRLALIGIALGAALSFGAAHLLSPLLFGIGGADPATFLTAILILTAVALLAGYLPARRASRIDPMAALRN